MELTNIIETIVAPLVSNKDALMVRELPNDSKRDVTFLIISDSHDTAKLIGRKGVIANALREVISIYGKQESVHVHLKFESLTEGVE